MRESRILPLNIGTLYLPAGMHHEFHAISSLEGRMSVIIASPECIVEYVRIGTQRVDMKSEVPLDEQTIWVPYDDCPIWVGVRNTGTRVAGCTVSLAFRGMPKERPLPDIIRRHDDAVRDARHMTLGYLERRGRMAMPSGILSPDLLKREKPS